MSTLAPLIDVSDLPLKVDELWEAPNAEQTRRQARRAALRRQLPHPEVSLLTVVALVAYVALGYLLRDHYHFWINDEINRTTDAVYTTIGRDPHLGAIGFYWPPLAQIIQCPLVLVLNAFGQTSMAGPISSAVCMALTIPVLGRIARMVGLGRPTTLLVLLTFAVNPVVAYYAANGMSEACFFLAGGITMWGFLAYIRERNVGTIALFAFGMSAVAMTRLEGPAMDAVLCVVAAFNVRDLKRTAWDVFILGLPPLAFFVFWMTVQYVLLGSFTFFLHQPGGGAPPKPGTASYLPNTAAHPLAAVPWALHWVYVLGPALALVAVIGLSTGLFTKRARGTIGILGAMATFLAIQIDQVIKGSGYGDPRYFVMAILFATVGVIWVIPRTKRPLAGLVSFPLAAVLLASGATGNWELTSARITTVEHECVFFEDVVAAHLPALGRSNSGCAAPFDGLAGWRETALWLDARMTPHDRVLTDNAAVPFPDLYTHKSAQYIVQNDDDWHKTVSNPYFVNYIITESKERGGSPDLLDGDQGESLVLGNQSDWKLVHTGPMSYSITHTKVFPEVYAYVGPPRSATASF